MDVWVSTKELMEMGMSEATIYRRYHEWTSRIAPRLVKRGRPEKEYLLASLPTDIQREYFRRHPIETAANCESADGSGMGYQADESKGRLDQLQSALSRFPLDERDAWISELNRLANLIQRYATLPIKRKKNSAGNYEFIDEVLSLCDEAACTNSVILAREPRRGHSPSPYTLDGWLREYYKSGLLAFLRSPQAKTMTTDRRKAAISEAAVEWVNQVWRNYRSPAHLYKEACKRARREGWTLPSESWFYRKWKELPETVTTKLFKGDKAYISKFAPFIPRTAEDLGALQLLCGDHRQCDVSVVWRDGRTLLRPWLTLWQCVRTGLIWGWHLSVSPSSKTISLAYAAGLIQFGAQPPARPDDGYQSYVYTDNGRDYRSRNLDDTITVHKRAASFDGSFELIRVQQAIGLYNEVGVKEIFARGYNAKEKPVERTNRDFADWDMHFDSWCGRDAKNKPDYWVKSWHQHQAFLKGKRDSSPFMSFDEYLEAVAGRIAEYNSTEHKRSVLGGATIVPFEEYERLYPVRFKVSTEAIALMLMKSERRTIGKNGVGISAGYKTWTYLHPTMSEFKGKEVEVRFDDDDLSKVFVILPNNNIVQADLVTHSGYLTPNKVTASLIKQTAAREKKQIRDWQLLNQSMIRGESVQERVAAEYEIEEIQQPIAVNEGVSSVTRLTRLDRPRLRSARAHTVTVEQVSQIESDDSIFSLTDDSNERVSEWEFED